MNRKSFLIDGKPVLGLRYRVILGSTMQVARCTRVPNADLCLLPFFKAAHSGCEFPSSYFFALDDFDAAIDKCEGEKSYWCSKSQEYQIHKAFLTGIKDWNK